MRDVLAQRDHENKESLRALAQRTGVHYSKVIYWNTRFERRAGGRKAAASFVPAQVVPDATSKGMSSSSFEVVIDQEHRVVVPTGFHATELSRLIGVLRSC